MAPGLNNSAVNLARGGTSHSRSATFVREKGRAAPELGKIQSKATKMLVRFHGGNDPGFIHLQDVKSRNKCDDIEASVEALVSPSSGQKRGWDPHWSTH